MITKRQLIAPPRHGTIKYCPQCMRNIGAMEEFPVVKITKFERYEIPRVVAGGHKEGYKEEEPGQFWNNDHSSRLLKRIVEQTKNRDVLYKGSIYTRNHKWKCWWDIKRCEDVTHIVKLVMKKRKVKTTLDSLERLAGKEISQSKVYDLRSKLLLPRRHGDVGSFNVDAEGYKGLRFQTQEESCPNRVRLMLVCRGSEEKGGKPYSFFALDLARLYWEGKIFS